MAYKHVKPRPHGKFRHRSQIPMPAVAEVEQRLAGLLSPSLLAPLRVSPHPITKRLAVLPAAMMGQLLAEVCAQLQTQAPTPLPHPTWAPVREEFTRLAIVDGSTLEALRKQISRCACAQIERSSRSNGFSTSSNIR